MSQSNADYSGGVNLTSDIAVNTFNFISIVNFDRFIIIPYNRYFWFLQIDK